MCSMQLCTREVRYMFRRTNIGQDKLGSISKVVVCGRFDSARRQDFVNFTFQGEKR